jgi:hypothetical protein
LRLSSPGGGVMRQDIRDKSAFMNNRTELVNREVAEHMRKLTIDTKTGKVMHAVTSNVFIVQTMIDGQIAFPTWLAKYEQQLLDHGDEVRAISAADSSVAESVGAGSDLHLGSAFQSSQNELTKMFTMFGSWFNAYYQRMYKASNGGDLSEANMTELFNTVITMPIIVGVLSAAMIMDGPGDDPEPEDWALWVAKQHGLFLSGTVPVLRDMVGSFRGFAPSTVWSSGGSSLYTMITEISSYIDGNQSGMKFTSDMIKVVATVVPLPGIGNVTRALDYTDSYIQGNEGDNYNIYQALAEGANKN